MKNGKRLKYIDIARGIAMFIIVFGHTISATSAHSYAIYRILFFINVPIFFVLSGYMFRVKEGESFWKFVRNKFLRIMLPYFFWALLFLVPYFIFGKDIINQFSQESSFDIWTQIGNVFYGNGVNNALKQNGPLWFLPALFMTEVLFYYVIYSVKNKKMEVITFVATLIIGFLCTLFVEKIYLPWGLNSALTIGSFFYFGYLLKEWQILDRLKTEYNNICLFIVCILMCGLAIFFNESSNVVWADYQYLNYCLTIVAGITSALAILLLSKWIGKNKLMEYIGKNTMSILIFHKIIIVVAQTKLGAFSGMLMNSNIMLELSLSFVVSAVTIAVSIAIGLVLRRFLPELIGERRTRAVLRK